MRARISEYDKLEALGKKYLEGLKTANIEILKEAFHEKAYIYGKLNEKDKNSDPIQSLFDAVEKAGKCGEDFAGRVDVLSLDKDIAVLKIYEENWHGYNFTDHFVCWKEKDDWKIVTKAYTPIDFKK